MTTAFDSLETRLRTTASELSGIGTTSLDEVETCYECAAVEIESVAKALNELTRKAGETCPVCGNRAAADGPDALTLFLVRLGDFVSERVIRDALAAAREDLAQHRVDRGSETWTRAERVAAALRARSSAEAKLSGTDLRSQTSR